jgi:hypothetical protein
MSWWDINETPTPELPGQSVAPSASQGCRRAFNPCGSLYVQPSLRPTVCGRTPPYHLSSCHRGHTRHGRACRSHRAHGEQLKADNRLITCRFCSPPMICRSGMRPRDARTHRVSRDEAVDADVRVRTGLSGRFRSSFSRPDDQGAGVATKLALRSWSWSRANIRSSAVDHMVPDQFAKSYPGSATVISLISVPWSKWSLRPPSHPVETLSAVTMTCTERICWI